MLPADVFVLRWTGLTTDVNLPLVMVRMTCEFHYTTGGTIAAFGLDRGRALEVLDAELLTILTPSSTPKMDYAHTPVLQLNTPLFWAAPEFTPLVTTRDRLTREARVTVFAYQEPGEL